MPSVEQVRAIAVFLMCCAVSATAQTPEVANLHTVRTMTLHQTRYRLRAGESVKIDAPRETLDYLLHAKTRRIEIDGKEVRGIVVGPNMRRDTVLLAASLTLKPGEYAVTVSAVSGTGEERAAVVNVTLDSMQTVPLGSTEPPVVLLNGLQLPSTLSEWLTFDTCPVSTASDTFGPLATQLMESPSASVGNPTDPGLQGAGVPVVYFFDNCVEDLNGQMIEDLGNTLGQVINLIEYSNGTQVPQVDLVSHSMGGLIVRSYLSGLQTNGALSPPLNPRVRKFIEIATPNFGSFLAANWSDFIANGTQTSEMIPGSPFLWYLATWNQRGDDLRGVDALAIVGDAGYWQANNFSVDDPGLSDGVVSITSASLGFVPLSYARSPVRTRILPYCHVPPGLPIDCTGGGIAHVDEAPETGAIILSFLENTADWQSIGNSNQTQYGGLYFALENAAGTQYTALESAALGSVSLNAGENASFFYNEFINVTGTLTATSTANEVTNCGSVSVAGGYYSAVRCKFSPSIYGVQSNLSTGLPGLTVASGSTITVSGVGFSSSTGTALLANGVALSGQIVSDQEITAFLPSNYSGLVSLAVSNSAGQDAINVIVASPALPATISVSPTQLQFSYTVGGVSPPAQTVNVANSGGGTLTWSATATAAWLALSAPASSTLAVSVSPAGMSAGTYTSNMQILAAGASNSPVTIPVTLTVAAAAASLAVAPQALVFNYTVGGAVPAAQRVSITNGDGGTLSWAASSGASWVGLSPASGTAPATLSVAISPAALAAGTYTASVQITAAGASGSPAPVGITLVVQAPAPVFTVALSTAGQVEPFAAQSIVSAYGVNLATGTAPATSLPLPTLLDGITVTVTDSAGVARLAPLFYVSPAQVNFEIPAGTAPGRASVSILNQNGTTQSATIQIGNVSPGLFALNGSGLVAAWVLPVISGTQQPLEPVYQITSGNVVALPINLGPATEQVYLEMYGTGIRNANSVTATAGGLSVPVLFAGAAPGFAGEDQVNIGPLPRALAGQGNVSIIVTADDQANNTVNVTIQ